MFALGRCLLRLENPEKIEKKEEKKGKSLLPGLPKRIKKREIREC